MASGKVKQREKKDFRLARLKKMKKRNEKNSGTHNIDLFSFAYFIFSTTGGGERGEGSIA